MKYRIGSVPFLNAVPLVANLPSNVEVEYAVPSLLPPKLESDDVSAILVSSIEALRRPKSAMADGAVIGSEGEVLSVRLFSKVPFEQVETVAFDQSSMTSNALARIVLHDLYGRTVSGETHAPHLDSMLANNDAAILIGDNGMRPQSNELYTLDLGSAWLELTGLPFVWAVWLGKDSMPDELAEILNASLEASLLDLPRLIEPASRKFGFDQATVRTYFNEHMNYRFGDRQLRALEEFGRRATSLNLIEHWTVPTLLGSQPRTT